MLVHTHSFLDSRIFKKEAKALQKNGYDVTMIVPRIKGKLFDIDKRPFDAEFSEQSFVHEGIKIITYNLEEFKPTPYEMERHIGSGIQSKFKNPLTQIGLKENADVYHAHELASLYAGIGIKRMMKEVHHKEIKLIYDSHDLIPDPLDNKTRPEAYNEAMLNVLNTMIKEIDQLITVSHSIKSWYLSKEPLLPVEIIYNSPPLDKTFEAKGYADTKLTVCYEGHVADNKKGSKDKIFEITELCAEKTDFNFKIIGGVLHGHSLTLPKKIEKNVELAGWVDYHSISKHMEDVDIGWIDFDDLHYSLNRSYALPNKFFSYLNNGIPVVVNKCHEMEEFIRTHHCGLVINKTKATAADYAKAFLYLNENKEMLKQMSANARSVMERLYKWENMEKRLMVIYESLINDNTTRFLM